MSFALRAALGAFLLLPAAAPVTAQGVGLQLGDLKQDESQPVEITSNQLEVDQAAGTAIFTGDVVVVQGELRLSSERVEAVYSQTAEGGQGGISSIHATGNVVIASGSIGVQAKEAVYSMESDQIVMTGDVVVTQQGSTITGQKLVVNVGAGTGRMEGRVRTVLETRNPSSQGNRP